MAKRVSWENLSFLLYSNRLQNRAGGTFKYIRDDCFISLLVRFCDPLENSRYNQIYQHVSLANWLRALPCYINIIVTAMHTCDVSNKRVKRDISRVLGQLISSFIYGAFFSRCKMSIKSRTDAISPSRSEKIRVNCADIFLLAVFP